ncbi:hypothetical protein SBOR_9533 [Sclerotinia borealis F-4128]|uniref:Uncharacterized protein n=1 Tax=Sclerotinia borealis (strain F-4128) TaxID=1432307 RepID=W9BZT4_SCLBF|nr:hypothetical protein SBOR_9533 [Sclerotinia borealis F-4128]
MADEPPRKRQRGVQSPKYTTLGDPERYTAHEVAALKNIYPLKSGLTPLKTPDKNASQAEKDQYLGFTTAELDELGALGCTSNIDDVIALENTPIHPCLTRENWISLGLNETKYELGGGKPGYWEASNDVVWQVFSSMLASCYALFFQLELGEMVSLLDDPHNFKKTYLTKQGGKVSNPALSFDLHAFPRFSEVEDFFRSHAGKFDIVLLNGKEDVDEIFSYGSISEKGFCGPRWKFRLELAFQSLEPLLNPKNTPAEKFLDRHSVACTILHEIAHLMFGGRIDSGMSRDFRTPAVSDAFKSKVNVWTRLNLNSTWYPGESSIKMPASDDLAPNTNKDKSHEDHRVIIDRIGELILKSWEVRRYLREFQFSEVRRNWRPAWVASTSITEKFLRIVEEISPKAPPPCPRFEEIREYLFANTLPLALDTTKFQMPIMLMLQYIQSHGGIELTIDEWRGFLAVAEEEKCLFKYDPTQFGNLGSLVVRWEGWPQELLNGSLKRDQPPMPPDWASWYRPSLMAAAYQEFVHDLLYLRESERFAFLDNLPDADKEHLFFYVKFKRDVLKTLPWRESDNPFEFPGALKPKYQILVWGQFEYFLWEAIESTERMTDSGESLEEKKLPRVSHAPKGLVRVLDYYDEFYVSEDESSPPSPPSENEDGLEEKG